MSRAQDQLKRRKNKTPPILRDCLKFRYFSIYYCPQAGRPRRHNAAAPSSISLREISGFAGTEDIDGCLSGDCYSF